MDTAVFILAGGSGSRLWPLSRKNNPKQFCSLCKDGRSFFEMTLLRALKITDISHIFVLTQNEYLDLILSQAPHLPKDNILCEPTKRNTAPAIATAILRVKNIFDDMVAIFLTADQYIGDEDIFFATVNKAVVTAHKENSIVTIGVSPTRPDSSFGYIKSGREISSGIYEAEGFTEKPDKDKALEFVSDKSYFWNSGIVICKLSMLLGQYKKYLPEVFSCAEKFCSAQKKEEADLIYNTMPNVSIDYGILEKTSNLLVVKGYFGWDDIGSWNALERLYEKDDDENILKGLCVALDTHNCTVISKDGLTIAAGLENILIIKTADIVLICPKESTGILSQLPSLLDDNEYKDFS